MLRLIIQSTQNGERESVIFTDEFDVPSENFLKPGYTVDFDQLINIKLPSAFPVGYVLNREY